MKKLSCLVVLFLLILSSVQAKIFVDTYSLDYVTSSTEEGLKICSCSSKADRFQIQNIGDFNAAYRVGVRSPVQEWFGFSDLTFALQPGQKKSVEVFMDIPCDAQPGSYEYTALVASNHDGMKEIKRPFQVVRCQNLGFELLPSKVSAKSCGIANFQAHIQNVGLFSDRFTLSSDLATFSEPSVLLKAQEEKTIYGYVAVPCSEKDNFEVPIHLASQNNKMSSEKTLAVQVQEPLLSWGIEAQGGKLSLCAEVPYKVLVPIANGADAPLDYELSVKGVGFAQIVPVHSSLPRNGFEKAELTFHPRKADVGQHEMVVSLNANGDVDSKSLQLEVADCHGFSAKFVDLSSQLCCGEKTLTLNIRNQASQSESFKFFSSDVKVLDASIPLRPGENGNIRVLWNAPCENHDALIRVTVVPVSKPELAKDVALPMEVLSQESCHQVGLSNEPWVVNKGDEKLTVKVKNLGIEPALYNLELSSNLLSLPFGELYLEPNQAKEIPLRLNLGSHEPGKYVSDLVLSPKGTSVQYVESVEVELKDSLSFNWKHILTVAVVLLIFISVQLFAIWRGRKAVKRKR